MRARTVAGSTLLMTLCLTGCGGDAVPTAPAGQAPPGHQRTVSPTAAPVIGVSPTSLSFLVYAFRPQYNPPGQTLKITNLGGGTLNWTARENGYWLTLSTTSGTAPGTVTALVHRSAIPIGLNGYRPAQLQAAITVSGTGASNTPVTIPVLLSISYVR